MAQKHSPKVLIIRNNTPSAYGGGETYQLLLAEQLRLRNFQPVIVSSCRRLRQEAQCRGFATRAAWRFPLQNWSSWRNLLLPVYYLWQLVLIARYCWLFLRLRPSAVNVQSRDDLIAATVAGRICHTRVLWTDHADFRNWVLQNVTVKHKNAIGKTILKLAPWAYRIILISDADYQYLHRLPQGKTLQNLSVIKNGVIDQAQEVLGSTHQDSAPAQSTALNFCYFGRIVKEKGIAELLSAFEQLAPDYPETELHLYGDGPDFNSYREANKHKHVVFHGFTDRPLEEMAKHQIYILPSYMEGLSLSLVEACMLSRTIIATEVGGNPEVIQDHQNGLLVPARDVNALATAMRELLAHPQLCQRYARAARATYEQQFDFAKTFAQQMLPLYQQKEL